MKILRALIRKEFYQIVRDPSSILITIVLPLMLLLIYMYGVNLDTLKVSMGFKIEDPAQQVVTLVDSFKYNKFIDPHFYQDKKKMEDDLVRTKLRGFVIIPNDFSTKLDRNEEAQLIVVTDGSETNLANYSSNYTKTIANKWLTSTSKYAHRVPQNLINPQSRIWYNQELDSNFFVMPGSLSITMTLVGMLLTALVIAREWERGTMEALLTTRIKKHHIVLGKYIAYYILGLLSMAFNVFMITVVFDIPFRGSYIALFTFSSLFLLTCMGQGLLVSTVLKDQYKASQAALIGGFLPALMLSGLIYPIKSMPMPIQWLSALMPSRYLVACIQNEFMAGTIFAVLIPNCLFLLTLVIGFFLLVFKKTEMRLD